MSNDFEEHHEDEPGEDVWSRLKDLLQHPDDRVELRRDPNDPHKILARWYLA